MVLIYSLSSYREARVGAVDVISRACRGDGAAVTSQHILTSPLKVKGSAVECVVVRVAEDRTHAWLCGEIHQNKQDLVV